MTEDQLRKALRKAFQLGQKYWQQADSESWKENRKSADTLTEFETFIDETIKQEILHD